jgi:hypothetical protein
MILQMKNHHEAPGICRHAAAAADGKGHSGKPEVLLNTNFFARRTV